MAETEALLERFLEGVVFPGSGGVQFVVVVIGRGDCPVMLAPLGFDDWNPPSAGGMDLRLIVASPPVALSAMLDDETVVLFDEDIGDARPTPHTSLGNGVPPTAGGITATRLWVGFGGHGVPICCGGGVSKM